MKKPIYISLGISLIGLVLIAGIELSLLLHKNVLKPLPTQSEIENRLLNAQINLEILKIKEKLFNQDQNLIKHFDPALNNYVMIPAKDIRAMKTRIAELEAESFD